VAKTGLDKRTKVEAKRKHQKPVRRDVNLKRLEGFTDEVTEGGFIQGV